MLVTNCVVRIRDLYEIFIAEVVKPVVRTYNGSRLDKEFAG